MGCRLLLVCLLVLTIGPWSTPAHGQYYGMGGLAAGSYHLCVDTTHERAGCIGANDQGQLGDQTLVSRLVLQPVSGDGACEVYVGPTEGCFTDASLLYAGERHTCALGESGVLYCWGDDRAGQLGPRGGAVTTMPSPVDGLLVPRRNPAVFHRDLIALGRAHTCAVTGDLVLRCWGANDSLQLGQETARSSSREPVELSRLGEVLGVVAAANYTCARRSGDVVCWGDLAALGIGDTTGAPSLAVPISGLESAVELAAGPGHLCARLSTGQVACVGRNDHGQLGDGTTASSSRPVMVVGLTDAVEIGVGRFHSCARRGADSYRAQVVCWGGNGQGQVGDGTSEDRWTPVPVQTVVDHEADLEQAALPRMVPLTEVFDLAVGATFTCAQPADVAHVPTFCWGAIEDSESGLGHQFGHSAVPFPLWL